MPEPDSDIEDGFGKGYSYKRESGGIRQGFGAEIVGERLVALYKFQKWSKPLQTPI